MNENEAWFLSKIVAGIVVVMGVFVYWSLTTEQYEDLLSDYEDPSSRRPASLVKITDLKSGVILSQSVMSTLDLNCIDSKEKIHLKSQSHQLRLVGKLCHVTAESEDAKPELFISNTSNGVDATVFDIPSDRFSTDFVYLKDGENRVMISALKPNSETMVPVKEIIIEKLDKLVLSEDSQPTDSR